MTDTTDIAALTRPVRDRYDWSNAVWRDCDHCGKQHTGTVTAEDGSQICSHCADQLYWSAWQVLAERALDQLEVISKSEWKLAGELVEQMKCSEKAEKTNAFLKEELAQQANFNPDWDMLEACRESWREVVALLKEREAEIAALKAKLANPVVLSDCSFEAVSHMAHWYSEGECVAWVSGAEHVKKQIVAAGFSVREE